MITYYEILVRYKSAYQKRGIRTKKIPCEFRFNYTGGYGVFGSFVMKFDLKRLMMAYLSFVSVQNLNLNFIYFFNQTFLNKKLRQRERKCASHSQSILIFINLSI